MRSISHSFRFRECCGDRSLEIEEPRLTGFYESSGIFDRFMDSACLCLVGFRFVLMAVSGCIKARIAWGDVVVIGRLMAPGISSGDISWKLF